MFEEVHTDDEESGNMGDSNDEGAEANIHHEGINMRSVGVIQRTNWRRCGQH